jgi:hypothetical protein
MLKMISDVVPEEALKNDLARTLRKIRRARLFGDLAARLIQSGRAAALNRRLRTLRSLRRQGRLAA